MRLKNNSKWIPWNMNYIHIQKIWIQYVLQTEGTQTPDTDFKTDPSNRQTTVWTHFSKTATGERENADHDPSSSFDEADFLEI
jgi:hypothetical protein